MTELDIERERLEFEAWYIDPDRSGSIFGYQGTPEGIHAAFKEQSYVAWLAAKRAALDSAEPVAWWIKGAGSFYLSESSISPNDHKLGVTPLFTAPPAPVSAEPVKLPAPDRTQWDSDMPAPVHYYTASTVQNLLASAPPSTDAKDSDLKDVEIERGWHDTFSTSNPYCPCNLKSFTKTVRWTLRAIAAKEAGK